MKRNMKSRLIRNCRAEPASTTVAIVYMRSLEFKNYSFEQVFDVLGLLLREAQEQNLIELELLVSLSITSAVTDDCVASPRDVNDSIAKLCNAFHGEQGKVSLKYRERAEFFANSILSLRSSHPSFGKQLFSATVTVHDKAALAHARKATIFCGWKRVFLIDYDDIFARQPANQTIVDAFTQRPLLRPCDDYINGLHRLADLRRIAVRHGNNRLFFVCIMTIVHYVTGRSLVVDIASLNITFANSGRTPHISLSDSEWVHLDTVAMRVLLKMFEARYIDEVVSICRQSADMRVLAVVVHNVQSRRRVVGKLVQNVLSNILKSAKKREKRVRRRRPLEEPPEALKPPPSDKPPEASPTEPSSPLPPLTEEPAPTTDELTRAECVVCLDDLESRRALLVCCKTARVCADCASLLTTCPLCSVAIDRWNEPIIIII